MKTSFTYVCYVGEFQIMMVQAVKHSDQSLLRQAHPDGSFSMLIWF